MSAGNKQSLFFRICSISLIVLHLVTFGPVRDALAFTAQSASYKINAATLNEGGNSRTSPTSYKLTADSIGEPCIGKSQSATYILQAGLIPSSIVDGPVQNQIIPNFSWSENSSKSNAFDLDNYFSSPTGLPLTYSVSGNSKIIVSIDSSTHLVNFSQPASWFGTEKVIFYATDSAFNSSNSNEVTLLVQGINNPPVLDYIPDISVNENQLVKITPHATDLDGDAITYSFTSPLNSAGEWLTRSDSAGTYVVNVTARDATGLSDFQEVKISVKNVNQPPVFASIPAVTFNEGELVTLNVSAVDPDGDPVNFYYNSPFDSTGKWLTDYDDAGVYTSTVTASDGISTVPQSVNITVNNVNRAPLASLSLSKYTASPNEVIQVNVSASDPDGDTKTFVLKKDGTQFASGSISSTYSTTASFPSVGDHNITLTVTDSKGAVDEDFKGVDIVDPSVNPNTINPILGDFDGDALLDLGIHNNALGKWEICLSDGGVFRNAVDWASGIGNSSSWWPMGGDFNADGKSDAAAYNYSTGEFKVAFSTGSAFGSASTWLTVSFAGASWQPVSGNFNGDKYPDLAFYNKDTGEFRFYNGTGTGFSVYKTSVVNFGTGFTALSGDFNGDSLADLCLFNKSSGIFKVAFSNTKDFVDYTQWLSGFAANKDVTVSDFNHDGLSDVGYWDSSSYNWYYAISTGAAFINKNIWLNYGAAGADSGTIGDFNGDGVMDCATFDRELTGINRWAVKISTDKPSDLLTMAENGIGGRTEIAYSFAAAADNDQLPFPVYVVSSVKLIDTLPATEPVEIYTHNFSYSGGYFDFIEREFRGFNKVTVRDPVTNNFTETYFLQGKPGIDGALKGQIEKIIAFDGNGRKISETINTYEVKKAGPEDRILGFPALKNNVTTVWEENSTFVTVKNLVEYDNLGNPVSQTSLGDINKTGDEKSTTSSFAQPYLVGFNRPVEARLNDKDGNCVTRKNFGYDGKGNLLTETGYIFNPLTGVTTEAVSRYTYDEFGNLLTATDPLNRTVTTEYESVYYSFPQRVINSLGHTVQYDYDARFGVVTSSTDANGNTSQSVYDSFGRVVEVINAYLETVVSYSYPDFNTKISTNPFNLTKIEYLDGLGRKYKAVSNGEQGDALKNVSSEVYYNNRGLVDRESQAHYVDEPAANIAYLRYEYDIRGRVKKTVSDFSGTTSDAYAEIRYLEPLYVETIDPMGHRKGTRKDAYGNILEATEFADGSVNLTRYEYDIQANLTRVTDAKGNISQMFFDSAGRKLKMIDPDMGTWTYVYDIIGNLLTQTDAKGQVLAFEYDQLNRLKKKIKNNFPSSVLAQYNYDIGANQIGRLSGVTDGSGATSFEYDKLGREIRSTKTVDGVNYVISREYDSMDRLTSLTYPDGEKVSYFYDGNSGLLERVWGASSAYVQFINYNASGQIKDIRYGNNVITTYSYGMDQRLSQIYTYNGGGGNYYLQNLNYTFDKNGNIVTLSDNLRNSVRQYTYDGLDRLIEARNLPGAIPTFYYQYDAIGNMVYKSDTGVMSYGQSAGPHAVTAAGGYSYQYDANGNMVSGKNKTMLYDAENRLTKVTESSGETRFVYDGDGGRVKKITSSSTTTYIGSLYEVESDGKITKHIFAGANRVTSSNNRGSSYYYHSDHLGSSNVVTNHLGYLSQRTEYTPYGTTALNEGADLVRHKFTGKELDKTGLYFYGARYYDPEIGRFITADTIVQAPFNPQTLNRYTYCGNNPFNYVDPSGHFAFLAPLIIAAIKGAMIGAAIGAASAAIAGEDIGRGALLGAISGAVFAGVGQLAQTAMRFATISGGIGPMTSGASFSSNVLSGVIGGGAAGASVAGYLGANPLQGAGYGALSGGVFGGIGMLGGDSLGWDFARAAMCGAAGGGISELAGGSFKNGFAFSGAIAGSDFVYRSILRTEGYRYGASMRTARTGGKPKYSTNKSERIVIHDPRSGISNVGGYEGPGAKGILHFIGGETGPVMSNFAKLWPGGQGLGNCHDITSNFLATNFGEATFAVAFNFQTMPPVYALNAAGAAINDLPAFIGIYEVYGSD